MFILPYSTIYAYASFVCIALFGRMTQCTNLVSVIVTAHVSQTCYPIITSTDLELALFRSSGNKVIIALKSYHVSDMPQQFEGWKVPDRLFSSLSFYTWRNGGTENLST